MEKPEKVSIFLNVIAVVIRKNGQKEIYKTKNIVTYAGDDYYAQRAANETPDIDFTSGGLLLGTGTTTPTKNDTSVTTPISGSGKSLRSGYPKTDDDDSDNSGAGTNVSTWSYYYADGDVVAEGIAEGAIVNNTSNPTAALSHFLFSAPFDLTSGTSLKIFVNHKFSGVSS